MIRRLKYGQRKPARWLGIIERALAWSKNTTLGSRAPDPDFITGLGCSKMGNLRYCTKNPARWGSKGGANQESALSH
jgi:hypothetical protein